MGLKDLGWLWLAIGVRDAGMTPDRGPRSRISKGGRSSAGKWKTGLPKIREAFFQPNDMDQTMKHDRKYWEKPPEA